MPLWMLKFLPNMPACHVGISVNAQGPNNTLVLGDVSGPAALIESIGCLDRGLAKIAITGAAGTRASITRMNYRSDSPMATIADPVANSSRPHDPSSDGIVGGEAAACLIVETAEEASARGAKPIASVAGFASRFSPSNAMRTGGRTSKNDAAGTRASSTAIGLSIDAALSKARIAAGEIGVIISNASGDPVSDSAEREAIETRLSGVPVVAPMASIGHTGAACGTIGIATGALCLAHQKIPPTVNSDAASVNLLDSTQPLSASYALCLSYTSEGNAIAIVLSKG